MKRRYKILIALLLSLILTGFVTLSILNHQTRQKSANIFDEMYYDETSFATRVFQLGGTHFDHVKGISVYHRGYNDEGATSYEFPNSNYRYSKTLLGKKRQYLITSFYYPPKTLYDDGIIDFSTNWILDDDYEISIDYYYNVKTKVLAKSFAIYDKSKDIFYHTSGNEQQIERILQKINLSTVDIYRYGDDSLHKILTDWTSVYHSRFSSDHWGKVTVKEVQTAKDENLEELTSK